MTIYTTTDIIIDSSDRHQINSAHSVDGRYSWHHGSDGYVLAIEANASVYLQHGERDARVSADTLAEMRAFSRAISACEQERREGASSAALTAAASAPTDQTCPHYTDDQGCPLHGETCRS